MYSTAHRLISSCFALSLLMSYIVNKSSSLHMPDELMKQEQTALARENS